MQLKSGFSHGFDLFLEDTLPKQVFDLHVGWSFGRVPGSSRFRTGAFDRGAGYEVDPELFKMEHGIPQTGLRLPFGSALNRSPNISGHSTHAASTHAACTNIYVFFRSV